MTREDKEKYRHKAYSFRLHEGTMKELKEFRQREEISWNKLIYKLIKEYEQR